MNQNSIISKWKSLSPYFHSLLRIFAAWMFIQAGSVKLFAFPVPMPGGASVSLLSQVGIGGILEFVGGLMILFGFYTRPAAFILSGEMAVAYFQFHYPANFWPVVNQGVAAVLYCFVWLYFSAAGSGPWSIDALREKQKKHSN